MNKKKFFNFYIDATIRRTIVKYMTIVFLALLLLRVFLIASFFSYSPNVSVTLSSVFTYTLAVFSLLELIFLFPDLKLITKGLWLVLIVVLTILFFHHTMVKEYICGTVIFLVTLTALPKVKLNRWIILAFLGIYLLYTLFVIIFANRDPYDTTKYITLNPNTSAYVCLLAGMALVAFADSFTSKRIAIPLALSSVLFFFFVYLFGSRAALIGVVLFVAYLLLKKYLDKVSKKAIGWLTFIVCIGAVLFAFFFSKVLYVWLGDENVTLFGKDIFSGRQVVWSAAFEQIKGNWLFGIGNTLYSPYGNPTRLDNQMMGYLINFGVITLSLIVALIISLMSEMCSSKKMAIGTVLVLLVSGFFETYFFYETTVSYTCIVLFIMHFADQQKKPRKLLAGRKFAELQAEEKKPLISVIVPVYNVENYLEECVRSILAQSYINLEIILVNDGSKDGSLAVCRALAEEDPRIKIIDKKNGGVSSARNAGLDAAKGMLIAFVDGDDYIEPDAYARMYLALKEENADIVFCRFQKEYSEGKSVYYTEKKIKKILNEPWKIQSLFYSASSKEQDRIVTQNTHGSVCRSLFFKELIDKKKIRFEKGLALQEDKLFLMQYLALCGKGAFVDHYLYHYRAEREGSAITNFQETYQKYYEQQKAKLDLFYQAIEGNKGLKDEEREGLKFLEAFDICFNFAVRAVKYDAKQAEKICQEDEFLQNTLAQTTIKRLLKNKVSFKRILFTVLLKKKKYSVLRRLVKFAE